jgi:sRNA-binding carbon storage regulator CsrA
LDSLRLFCLAGTNAVELPLPPLPHGSNDHSNRLVQLGRGNRIGIEIPASVSELRAEIVMTFRHRATGRTETKVFTTKMLKKERTKYALPD